MFIDHICYIFNNVVLQINQNSQSAWLFRKLQFPEMPKLVN